MMIHVFINVIFLLSGFLLGIAYMIYEEWKLKKFVKAAEDATDKYIASLEKSNEFWKEQTSIYEGKYYDELLKVSK